MIRFSRMAGAVAVVAALVTAASTTAASTTAATQVCEVQNVTDTARIVNLVPPRVGGDADFAGHGPQVSVRVTLATRPDSAGRPNVLVHVDMTARETQSDFTTAAGGTLALIRVWLGFEGWRVDGVVGMDTVDALGYTDTDHADDVFGPNSPTSFVQGYRVVGDTPGDEAGTETFVQVNIKPITLRLSRGCP